VDAHRWILQINVLVHDQFKTLNVGHLFTQLLILTRSSSSLLVHSWHDGLGRSRNTHLSDLTRKEATTTLDLDRSTTVLDLDLTLINNLDPDSRVVLHR